MTKITKTEIPLSNQQFNNGGSSSSNQTTSRYELPARNSSNSESECIEVIDSSSSEVPHQSNSETSGASEFSFNKKISQYTDGDRGSSVFEESASDVKTESEEDESLVSGSVPNTIPELGAEEYPGDTIASQGESMLESVASGMTRSGRQTRQTKFFGNPIASNVKGILTCSEVDPSIVTAEDRRMNPDMVSRARAAEIEGWRKYNVFSEIDKKDLPEGSEVIGTRYVETWKLNDNGSRKMKARLVILGNQDSKAGQLSTYAPTCSREVVMLSMHLMCSNNWSLYSMDIEKAFLQSREMVRDVFVKPPKEAGCGSETVWKLRKAAYGLGEAAKEWHETIKPILLDLGFKASKVEPAVFYMKD